MWSRCRAALRVAEIAAFRVLRDPTSVATRAETRIGMIGLAAGFLLTVTSVAWAQAPYDDEGTPEGWAWKRIRQNEIADFQNRCGQLDAHENSGWDAACRRISSGFLVDLLTNSKFVGQVPLHGVDLRGVKIFGTIDLAGAETKQKLTISDSWIEGDIILTSSHWAQSVALVGSTLTGKFLADGMRTDALLLNDTLFHGEVSLLDAKSSDFIYMDTSNFAKTVNGNRLTVEGSLLMRRATFSDDAILISAKVGSNLEMDASSFAKTVNGDRLTVGGSLFMRHATFKGDVILRGGKVGGNLEMDTSTFDKVLNGNRLTVGGALFMRNHATFNGDVILMSAKVGSSLEMDASTFDKAVDGDSLTVEGSLFMRHATFKGDVNLRGAKVGSTLEMDTSAFDKAVDGDRLTVEGSLFMRFGAGFRGRVALTYAKVASLLDLRGAKAWTIDVSEGKAGEIQIGGLEWWCADGKPLTGVPVTRLPLADSRWRSARCDGADATVLPKFTLRNFQVGAFQDSADAWPPVLDLEGFRFDRLGGFESTASTDMRKRSPDEWIDWLARDRAFGSQPYNQLASVLSQEGYRDPANDIQFAGRERERVAVCNRSDQLGTCAWLTTLSLVAGYGVGLHMFRVLWGVIFFTLLGTVAVSVSRKGRAHSIGWRLGASLHRLLPIISLSKEFEEFFDNRSTDLDSARNLNRFQTGYFAVHAIAGWALGLILLAAMSGLTSKG